MEYRSLTTRWMSLPRLALAERVIIADTSPLITLVGVELLDLLPQLYGRVLIPEQVLAEYLVGAQPAEPDIRTFSWLQTQPVEISPGLLDELDMGEAAVIALAHERKLLVVLMDDRAGRRVAREHGLEVIGTLAVLLRAKATHLISTVGPILDRMIEQGRHISPALRIQVLTAADEIEAII